MIYICLINLVFCPFLHYFILVFSYDILIYSKTWKANLTPMDQVLHLLYKKIRFLKYSKFAFRSSEVYYLGHIIGKDGAWVDPKKIEDMKDFPHIKTLKILLGFLDLTRYYHKFFQNYGKITSPLTVLLKKKAFSWTPTLDRCFQALKEAMCTNISWNYPNSPRLLFWNVMHQGKALG